MAKTFLWHDYETFGVNARRDRPAQFAAVRTDLELNVIGEPIMIYCKPQADYLPDPIACMITGITPQECLRKGIPEPEFAAIIQRELGTPGTVGVGYNTIKFDDEVTRFMFWRNMMDPYSREWKDDCGRWDIIDVVRAMYALRPDGIKWPKNEEGKQSFRLELLTKENGLVHEAAHDALSDVYATIAFAKMMKNANAKLFDYFFTMHKKDQAARQMDVNTKEPFIHITGTASETGGVSIMMPIAIHPTNKNEVIAWDLSKDPEQLIGISAEDMCARMFTKKVDQPEGFERMPIRSIATNKSPAVVKNLAVLSDTRAKELGVDVAAALANVEKVHSVLGRMNISPLLREVYSRDPIESDIDEALYNGFVHNDDRRIMDRITCTRGSDLTTLKTGFRDGNLDELFVRYKARNHPLYLTLIQTEEWKKHLQDKLVAGADGHRSFTIFQEQVAEKMVDATDKQKAILEQLLEYGEKVRSDMEFFMAKGVMPFETITESPSIKGSTVPATYSGQIKSLQDNEIFVFGSNPVGINGNPEKGTGGAALFAMQSGWVNQGEKLDDKLAESGKAWGITTVSYPGKKLSRTPEQICAGIAKLYQYAEAHPEKDFLVAYTTTGKNLNGYSSEDLAKMFSSTKIPSNMVFEENFAALLAPTPQSEAKQRINRP